MSSNPRIPHAAGRRHTRWILVFWLILGLLSLSQSGCFLFSCDALVIPFEQCYTSFARSYTPGESLCAFEGQPLSCLYCRHYENNGSFEGETDGGARGWLGDSTRVVTREQGIRPCSWDKMLRVEATTPTGPSPESDALVYQVIDLRDQDLPIPTRVVASMLVNRVPNSPDSEFGLTIEAYKGDPAIYPSALNLQIGFQSESFIVDNDPTTWRYLGTELIVSVKPDFVVVVLHASENVFNDANGTEFEGHYLDGARVAIGPAIPFDLRMTLHPSASVVSVGDDVLFTITLINDGPSEAHRIVVGLDFAQEALTYIRHNGAGTYDPDNRHWFLPSLAIGEAAHLTLTTNVPEQPTRRLLSVDARILSGGDLDPSNNHAQATTYLGATLDYDIQLDVTADRTVVPQGEQVTFSFTFSNHGPDVAYSRPVGSSEFQVFGLLPPGFAFDWEEEPEIARVNRGRLSFFGETEHTLGWKGTYWFLTVPVAPGPDSSYTLQMTALAAGAGRHTNHPQIAGVVSEDGRRSSYFSPFDDLANNTDSVTIDILPGNEPYNLELTLDTVGVYTSTVQARFRVFNHGPGIASHIIVSDPIPDGLTFFGHQVFGRPDGQQIDYDRETERWTIPFLLPGTGVLLDHDYAVQTGTYTKIVSIVGDPHPGDTPSDNTTTMSWSVSPTNVTYDLSISQRIVSHLDLLTQTIPATSTQAMQPPVVSVGEPTAFILTITNHGPDATGEVFTRRSLFTASIFDPFTTSSYPPPIERIEPGETISRRYVTIPRTPGAYANTASLRNNLQGDTNPSNNTDTDSVIVVINSPPIAEDDTAITTEDTPVTIAVLDNDTDPNGRLNAASIVISSLPTSGTAAPQRDFGTIRYTPDAGFVGTDTFSYRVRDIVGAISNTATVTVTVAAAANNPPVAVADTVNATPGVATDLDLLANDFDPDGDAISISAVGAPSNGTAEIINNGQAVRYTPGNGFTGAVVFGYVIVDEHGAGSTEALVTITVSGAHQ